MNQPPHRPLTLAGLRAFDAVAKRLSFSAAADELHLTQSAVSRQIKGLEDEVGALLFSRGTRRVELTAAGANLLATVAPLLQKLDRTVRQVRGRSSRRQVAVSSFASFVTLWLMPRLAEFQQLHPDIDIRISAEDRLVALDEPELDLVLRHGPQSLAPPGAVALFGEVLTPVASPRLMEQARAGQAPPLRLPTDLAAHALLEQDGASPGAHRMSWRHWLAEHGLPELAPRRWILLNYTHQQVQGALAGQGVALARLPLVHDLLERGELVEPFGPAGRLHTNASYWLARLQGGQGAQRGPELLAFEAWLLLQAEATRRAVSSSSGWAATAPEAETQAPAPAPPPASAQTAKRRGRSAPASRP